MQPFNRHKKTPYGGYYRLLLQDANPASVFSTDVISLAAFMAICKGILI